MASLIGVTTLGTLKSEDMLDSSGMTIEKVPGAPDNYSIALNLGGAQFGITLSGTVGGAKYNGKPGCETFISEMRAILSSGVQTSTRTFTSSIIPDGLGGYDHQVKVMDWSGKYKAGDPNSFDYIINLVVTGGLGI